MNLPTQGAVLPGGSVFTPSNGQTPNPSADPWKPGFWDNDLHIALQFDTTEELDRAIDWLWATPGLRELPRVHIGENTMVVPAQAAPLFTEAGFKLTLVSVKSIGELSADDADRVRREG